MFRYYCRLDPRNVNMTRTLLLLVFDGHVYGDVPSVFTNAIRAQHGSGLRRGIYVNPHRRTESWDQIEKRSGPDPVAECSRTLME